jgi:hypothetical protein
MPSPDKSAYRHLGNANLSADENPLDQAVAQRGHRSGQFKLIWAEN